MQNVEELRGKGNYNKGKQEKGWVETPRKQEVMSISFFNLMARFWAVNKISKIKSTRPWFYFGHVSSGGLRVEIIIWAYYQALTNFYKSQYLNYLSVSII